MKTKLQLTILFGLICTLTFGQVNLPATPQPTPFRHFGTENFQNPTNAIPDPMEMFWGTEQKKRTKRQNQQIIREVQMRQAQRREAQRKLYAELKTNRINYSLPSYGQIESTKYYRNAFEQLNAMNPKNFSVKKATFIIENAYFQKQKNYDDFNKIIEQTGDFLQTKMDELGYNPNSNLAKNFMLFQFFADTLQIKSKDLKHLPFKYDFEDYMGIKDWSKMFVTKLLATGKGQCNSLPRLYLILAEEIGAEAFLSLSPNHSYIKFRDKDDNWYNVELTNGMFTTNSFILQSGYIKAEALQNGTYMQSMTNQQLLSVLLTDFAQGYVHKFGYDSFVKKTIDRALELYPKNINANMVKSNYLTVLFEYVAHQAGINPRNPQDLQNIRYFPKIVDLLNKTNAQYHKIDNLGYEHMPAEAYENWLNSLKEAKQKQQNREMRNQFDIKLKPLKS